MAVKESGNKRPVKKKVVNQWKGLGKSPRTTGRGLRRLPDKWWEPENWWR